MTRFEDGPAKGQVLMLHRAVKFLRVTCENGKFDALDQIGDSPRPGELLYAYQIAAEPIMCHVNRGRHGSGFYPMATYRLVTRQPPDDMMRDKDLWRHWCEHQPDPLPDWQ